MNRGPRGALALGCATAVLWSGTAGAQGYRLRLDTRVQGVAYRGVVLDSIPVTDTVTGPGGGPGTPDGYAVQCTGTAYCTYFRAGPERRGGPFTTLADLSLWGFGVPGLSAHATTRLGFDLGDADAWPGTDPAMQLLEGYAEYARERATGRLGRQVVASRLGTTGFDGAWVAVRDARRGLDAAGYAGWGLARGAALPVTSPALNPLDDFQPRSRQLVAGLGAGWMSDYLDAHLDYQREVDPGTRYFVSERFGAQVAVRPASGVTVSGGADYDLAAGWWGSAEASVSYARPNAGAVIGVRRYRPHFDLWTIWGAFSPTPYHAVHASLTVTPVRHLDLRARGERYAFDDAAAATPLTSVKADGWRWELGGTLRPAAGWTLDGGWHRELGPGAASAGVAGSVTYAPGRGISVMLQGASLDRPLEFRFNEAAVRLYGIEAEYEATPRARFALSATRYTQDHRRPDAAAFDWNQTRIAARVVVLFGNGADLARLPRAVRRMPGGRSAR